MDVDSRWHGIKRTYDLDSIKKLRGSYPIEHTISSLMSRKLWSNLNSQTFINALGASTGNQAVQMVRAGMRAIYLSGWQIAADANVALDLYPDRGLYPSNSVPKVVEAINNALLRTDQIESVEENISRQWLVPIVADGEAGFGGVLNTFELTKALIKAGAAAIHLEDQLPSEKKCGHLGGKVLIPIKEFVDKLIAARLAADILDVPLVIIGRTDAMTAKLITSDFCDEDKTFINGERSANGFFKFAGGLEAAIRRASAFASYCDLIWWETDSPDLTEAATLANCIRREHPHKMFAYNCSPSFNWRAFMDEQQIASFQQRLGEEGFRFQFVTSAGFHAINSSMFKLAKSYNAQGMSPFVEMQQEEISLQQAGYTAIHQQRETANGYYDAVLQALHGERSDLLAMPNSTEARQFRF